MIYLNIETSIAQTNPPAQQIPYIQDFSNNWFQLSGLPPGFAVWTATNAPCISNTSAASNIPNGDDTGFDSATVVKSPGKTYGYSGINAFGNQINNGQIYAQTSSAASGTDQIVLSISTIGFSGITISFDVEMINPQPKNTGFAFQFRIGTSGAFTTIDSSYWHNSVDRIQNSIDNFENLLLPSLADNQPIIQLRWALSRGTVPSGTGSCGLGFDNIIVNGNQSSSPLFFRNSASGNWNSTSIWESSSDQLNWSAVTRCPNSSELEISLRAPFSVISIQKNSS